MTETEKERLLANCLEAYHRRRALGEHASANDWKEFLGRHYGDFVDIVAAESAIDDLIEPAAPVEVFPRSFGEYTLIGELGRGAMGVVYEAVHRRLGRTVALKVLRSGFEGEALALERFRREARACARIRHDHIVEIYDAGAVEGRPFYSMPRLTGRSLVALIKAGEAPGPAELCAGLADIADALETLHQAGIVHRDVKPGNIMVEADGRMILSDFGLARTAASQALTQTGEALGTPLYMSPEQVFAGKGEVDGRSDVYGLGSTLYEGLTGRPPFHADCIPDLMKLVISERPRPPEAIRPELPRAAGRIALKAMEKRKRDRYQTAAEMRDDLAAFAEGRPVKGRPVSGLRFRLRRYRPQLAVAAVLLVAAAGILGWLLTRPGTLVVDCFPVARVYLDEAEAGPSPLTCDLPPGTYRVRVVCDGFGDDTLMAQVRRGETSTYRLKLLIADTDDPVALDRLAGATGLGLKRLVRPPRNRGGLEGIGARVLYPRGDVRIEDLADWRFELLDPMLESTGTVSFHRGEKELHRARYEGGLEGATGSIPDAVRDALASGDEVLFRVRPDGGEPASAGFLVVDDRAKERLDRIETIAAEQPERARRHLRSRVLLDAGLFLAAYREARLVLEENPESPAALAVVVRALDGMGLFESELRKEALSAVDDLPEAARRAVYGDKDPE